MGVGVGVGVGVGAAKEHIVIELNINELWVELFAGADACYIASTCYEWLYSQMCIMYPRCCGHVLHTTITLTRSIFL